VGGQKKNYCCKRFQVGVGLDQERNSKLSIVCGLSRKASLQIRIVRRREQAAE
jgi:hypothetical protein